MKSFIEMKQGLKRSIMGAVHSSPELDKKKLMAQLCLDTGFKEATIQKVFDQLEELNFITQDNGIIKKVPPKPARDPPLREEPEYPDDEKGADNE